MFQRLVVLKEICFKIFQAKPDSDGSWEAPFITSYGDYFMIPRYRESPQKKNSFSVDPNIQ